MDQSKVIREIKGRAVPFLEDNVDTDQIAPTKEALYVLNWREAGDVFCIKTRRADPTCVLNLPEYAGARILLTGKNFGCGSSREHATQGTKALFDIVVANSFAPIYADNAFAIGLPTVKVNEVDLARLAGYAKANPAGEHRVNLEDKRIYFGNNESVAFEIEDAKRQGFLKGTWDERAMLTGNLSKSREVLSRLHYITGNY